MELPDLAGCVPAAPEQIRWIEDAGALDAWLEDHQGRPLALDTEFERVSTFYPIPGLVQLGCGADYCLVDPPVAAASHRFRQVLEDPSRLKLLYAMSEDLELFRHWLGVQPAGVVDLQIGAAMAGAGFSMGYARLVEGLFGESLDKSASRSDWLNRPLSEAQQRYALDDVRFLEPLYRWVRETLEEKGLADALREESDRFARELAAQDDPDMHYLRLRGGWALSDERQKLLRSLVIWREQAARRKDRPRSRVVPDAALIALAESRPDSLPGLSRIPDLSPGIIRRYGELLLDMLAADPSGLPALPAVIPGPLTRDQQALYKKLRKRLVAVAEARGIPIELLAPRRRLEAMIQQAAMGEDPCSGGLFEEQWRRELLEPLQDDIRGILTP